MIKQESINIKVLKTDDKCQECKKDWTKCSKCPVMMKWVVEMQDAASHKGSEWSGKE